MGQLTPSFLFDLESNMRLITQRDYQRLSKNVWWNMIASTMGSQSKKERITWLLETARIERPNASKGGGQAIFEDIVAQTVEYENENAVAGLKLKKEQLDDLDGNGVQLATHWSQQMGSYAAYWPQKELARAIRANPTAYDGQAFFSSAHPNNPFNSAAGTYANRFTGAASGIYPGALDISTAVTIDVAVANIAKALAYVASLKMPNGEDPRMLELAYLFVPPALAARAQQITNAKFIAQAAAGGAASGDIEAVIKNFALGQPIIVPELGSAFGGSDTTFYLGMREILTNELGAFIYINREPFAVNYYGPMNSSEFARVREFQWTTEGRNTIQPGHPYLLFRADAA